MVVLDHRLRLRWIHKNWEESYIEAAEETILEKVLSQYPPDLRARLLMVPYQMREYSDDLAASRQATVDGPSNGDSGVRLNRAAPQNDELDFGYAQLGRKFGLFQELEPEEEEETGVLDVESEFQAYVHMRRSLEHAADMDIITFWQVRASLLAEGIQDLTTLHSKTHQKQYPTLYAMAVDYLPIQATSVPCERAFSSSAETDTKKRTRLHPTLVESLQLMKFYFKRERMDFVSPWVTQPPEMTQVNPQGDHLAAVVSSNDRAAALDYVVEWLAAEDGVDEETED